MRLEIFSAISDKKHQGTYSCRILYIETLLFVTFPQLDIEKFVVPTNLAKIYTKKERSLNSWYTKYVGAERKARDQENNSIVSSCIDTIYVSMLILIVCPHLVSRTVCLSEEVTWNTYHGQSTVCLYFGFVYINTACWAGAAAALRCTKTCWRKSLWRTDDQLFINILHF